MNRSYKIEKNYLEKEVLTILKYSLVVSEKWTIRDEGDDGI